MNLDEENIRELISKEVNDILVNLFSQPIDDNYNSSFIGKVVNNQDPDKLGKCQVRIFGLYDNTISDSDLPWAIPDFGFIGSKKGSFIVPPKDTIVRIFFDKGDPYLPIYTAKVIDGTNLPSDAGPNDPNYPDTMVFFETDVGDKFTINRSTGDTKFIHKSGAYITIDGNGNVEVAASKTGKYKLRGTVDSTDVNVLGPFCALPNCLFTGAPHRSNTVIGQTP